MNTHKTSAPTVRRRCVVRRELDADISDASSSDDSLDFEQLDLEHERRVRRNYRWEPALAVGEVRRDRELAHLAHHHPGDPLVPSLDDPPASEREAEALPPVARAVEFRAVGHPAHVVY